MNEILAERVKFKIDEFNSIHFVLMPSQTYKAVLYHKGFNEGSICQERWVEPNEQARDEAWKIFSEGKQNFM